MEINFQRNVLITGKIASQTGLHIGIAKEELEIGGTDNPVIIDPRTRRPIIPGSSLKGKLRTLIELRDKKYSSDGSPHNHKKREECRDPNCDLCTIFGSSTELGRGPTRLIVRDAFCEDKEIEIKAENVINRLKGKAENPRFIERVPAGSIFNLDMIYSVYNNKDYENLKLVFEGMNQLEDNYLGGSGSRGYGKIEFKDIKFKIKTKEDYIKGKGGKEIEINGKNKFTVPEILDKFEELKKEIGK